RGHVLAMRAGRPGESYILAGPPATLRAVLRLAQHVTGVPAPRLQPAPSLLKAAASVVGLIERFVSVPDNYTAEYLRVAAGVTYLGFNARARAELGYQPRSLEEGLPETLQYELAHLD